jgi:uncharacterized protein (TIGR02145 family)
MKNLILLLAGLAVISLQSNSREVAGLQAVRNISISNYAAPDQNAFINTFEVTAGQLSTILTAEQLAGLTNLTLTGTIDARDFKTMRDDMPLLAEIDLSGANILAYSGTEGTEGAPNDYLAFELPKYSFLNPAGGIPKITLTKITLPENLTSISYGAFYGCTGLIKFNIPTKVNTIRNAAFEDCSNLTEILCYAENPPECPWGNMFTGVDKTTCKLYVPSGAIAAYQAASQWQDFENIVEMTPDLPIQYAVYDVDGNGYDTVRIGNQTWLKQNLYVTKYNDGSEIPNVTDGTDWSNLETPAYSWYNNDSNYGRTYGAYYNWYVVDSLSNGGKNVCPTGWRIPSLIEWHELANYLGGRDVAGGKMKVTGTDYWLEPNEGATNESGFSAVGAASRIAAFNGGYSSLNGETYFWNKEEASNTNAYQQWIFSSLPWLQWSNDSKKNGFSCRCIKDNTIAMTFVPDDNFEQALIDLGYDSGPLDDYVPTANISGLTSLDVSGKGISDLTGIQDFISLQSLNCGINSLTTIDLSKNLSLTVVLFYNNQLASLDVSQNSLLQQMYGNNNYITTLDLSQNPDLNTLDFGNNKLTSLDLSNNPLLFILNCSYNQIPSIDLSNNTNLVQIGVSGNPISTLDISNNKNLRWFFSSGTNLTEIDCSQHPALESIDCADNTHLTSLNLQNGNNAILKNIFVLRNPNLYCIQVDDPITALTYSNWMIDAHTSYSSDCSQMPVVTYPSHADIVLNNSQTYNITWSGFTGTRVIIELLKDNTVTSTIAASTPNDGTHPWTIPAGLESGTDYKIRVTSMENRSFTDISDNYFAVQSLANPMVLVPSEPGIIWNNGKTYNITWSGFPGSKVRIELIKGTTVRSTIAASTANDGSHPWTIAKNLETGSDYKIRITSVENRSVVNISNNFFTIEPATPNDGKKSAEIEINNNSNQGKLLAVYPNPFRDKVYFEFTLNEPAPVVFEIYTVTGLKVATLFNENVDAGVQTRFEYQPGKISAQILLYRLRIGDELETGKLIYKP